MINPALFFKELTENRIKLYVSFFILGVLAIAIPLLFEFAANMLGQIDLSPYIAPEELVFIFANFHNYAWSQWTAKNLMQMVSLTAIVLGMGALAGESAYGTAAFLLSKPLTRRQVYTTKVVAGLFLLCLAVFGPTFILILVSVLKGYTLQVGAFILSAVVVFAGAAVVYLGTAVFSVLIPEPLKAGIAAALFWGLAAVPGFFPETARYSIFFQMKALHYWLYGKFPWLTLFTFLAIALALHNTGVYLWKRRDF